MLEINGELCYSPHRPHRYGKGPLGHGMFCRDDLQVWNLLWLSCPMVDRYLKESAWEVARAIPSHYLADAMAALRGQNCIRLFPHLRGALQMPPLQFVEEVKTMQFQFLPAFLSDPGWLTTIQARAIEASGDAQLSAWEATHKVLDRILKGGNTMNPKPKG